jgi:phosphoglycolate phosphatase-like HAD superfamily hydrolase
MCEAFHKEWMSSIENESLLSLDKPFNDAVETLNKLSRKNDLFIVTARQNKNLTIKQITNLKLIDYFKDVLITEQKIHKEKIIMQNIDSLNINDIIIGDTKEDIDAGLALNIKKFGITTGMLNYNKLLMYKPDNIYNSLKEFSANIC